MEKEKQEEFKGMPELTNLGKVATEYIDVLGNVESWKRKLDELRPRLIELFKAEKRISICIDGITISHLYTEKDQIKIKKPE